MDELVTVKNGNGLGSGPQEIWEKVYHTDARVTAMEGQLTDLSHGVNRIEAHLLNKPPVNVAAWVAVVLTFVAMVVGLVWGMTNYIELTLGPTRIAMSNVIREVADLEAFQHETHYEIGVLHEWKRTQEGMSDDGT